MNRTGEQLNGACSAIRALRWAVLITLVVFIPVGFGAGVLSYRLVGNYDMAFALAGFMSAIFVIAFCALALWPCPRCRHRFVHLNALWPRKCHNCGFPC
jgi:ABC-type antimicrobial peptide transport system permease subunit